MKAIHNDHDLHATLDQLTRKQQRVLGARFVESILHLTREARVIRAVESAVKADCPDWELLDAYRAVKGHVAKTYADCGRETDWVVQADHFVAAAAAAALLPENTAGNKTSHAWKAAVHARMAKNCELMEGEEGEDLTEAERQYRIANEFLGNV